MKGARGLLISITGGPDMKIFEVDAAANRIREEVDMDANDIFGATQDESLEGIIRVSVVATGLDQAARAAEAGEPQLSIDQRLAMMADRLRSQMAARAQPQPAPIPLQREMAQQPVITPVMTPVMAPITAPVQAQPVMQPAAQEPAPALVYPPVQESVPQFNGQLEPDLVVAPAPPRPVFFAQPVVEPAPVQQAPLEETFIPPAPERVVRPQRMPSMDELPLPAQAMLQASRQDAMTAPPPPEAKRMSLMQRLASVGFGRGKDDEAVDGAETQVPAMPAAAQPSATHALYARRPAAQPTQPAHRPAQGQLDAQGRVPAPTRSFEDDQLEIPAFLRRQAK
jgi:cell division protein FtsZ